MASPLNILQESPYDRSPEPSLPRPEADTKPNRWAPSRYNVRATTEDGRLVLWNTFSGAMSVFKPDQVPTLKSMIGKAGFEAPPEGLVKYLLDRGFLLREGTDEHRRLQLAFGRQQYRTDTLQLFLLSSEDCNFRCKYCYEQFARGTMLPWVRTAIKSLVQNRIGRLNRLVVSWFGGEPLYGLKAIEELAPFFLKEVEEHSVSYFSHMTTNGYLLTPEVADRLLAWQIKDYQITIDGTPENHDCNRPTRDGRGTFWDIFNNLKALHQRADDFSVLIRVNFDQQNYPRLEQFFDLVAAELGGDPRFKLGFFPVGRWGGPNDERLSVCGLDETTQVQSDLKKAAHKRGLKITGTLKEVSGPGAQVCYAARPYNFIIGASGKVMKCTIALDTKDYNVVGYLREDGELMLDQDKLALWTEPAFENDKQCRKCVIAPTCQGITCPLVRIEHDRRPCPSVRLNLKQELLEVLEFSEGSSRKVLVDNRPSA
jgi:uncharacterized protein